jgi:peptidoglycan/xylan/chitin deacetylase (PgdA/CDA1 family)
MNGALKNAVKRVHFMAMSLGPGIFQFSRGARILMLHGIGFSEVSSERYEEQIEWLAKHFEIISLAELVARIENETGIDRSIVLTFDDGLLTQGEEAFPLLEKLGIPATVFVCPTLIDEGRWLWNHNVRARWREMDEKAKSEVARILGVSCGEEDVVQFLKSCRISERERSEALIRDFSEPFRPGKEKRREFNLMSWENLAELDPELFTIGCHTGRHPILPSLRDADLDEEIVQSKLRIEERLGKSVDFFCYPNGDFDERSVSLVRKHYCAGVSCDTGVVRRDSDRCLLPRIGIAESALDLAWSFRRRISS